MYHRCWCEVWGSLGNGSLLFMVSLTFDTVAPTAVPSVCLSVEWTIIKSTSPDPIRAIPIHELVNTLTSLLFYRIKRSSGRKKSNGKVEKRVEMEFRCLDSLIRWHSLSKYSVLLTLDCRYRLAACLTRAQSIGMGWRVHLRLVLFAIG